MIQIKLIDDVFTPGQKRELSGKLTNAEVTIKGESMRPVTWVLLEDVRRGNWGIAGQPMTTQVARAGSDIVRLRVCRC